MYQSVTVQRHGKALRTRTRLGRPEDGAHPADQRTGEECLAETCVDQNTKITISVAMPRTYTR